MKSESQIIEYKESWHDEYLKWVCGFANAQGGTLYIGVNDDKRVVGVRNAKRLMEDIPNMVKDRMGILVEVNLLDEDGKEYIQIVTSKSPNPISLRGKYYYRTGSTLQELKGTALDQFLLSKQGRTWDGVPVPGLTARMLDTESINIFKREAARSPHSSAEDVKGKRTELLARLHLYEGEYLKRAAALLFYSDPERYVTGAYIKIGYFANDADILYQDEIHGSLIKQIGAVLDLLTTKYMKAYIRYEGIVRVDELPLPVNALREGMLNAICHKSYEEYTPIQIRVYDDRIIISNTGRLPIGWTINNLVGSHISIPYNPAIANVFFRAGFIESWGRGIEKVLAACKDYGCPKPEWEYDGTALSMTLWYKHNDTAHDDKQVVNKHEDEYDLDRIVLDVSQMCPSHALDVSQMMITILQSKQDSLGISELMSANGSKSKRQYRKEVIAPAIQGGLIERTMPDKPSSRYQKYRLTDKGRQLLNKSQE